MASPPGDLHRRHPPSPARLVAAWGVHLYTASGLPLAFVAAFALLEGDARTFFLAQMLAAFVDATDGALARLARVGEVLPAFDGRRLDDLVDFLHFVFLPCLALPLLGILPPTLAWVAVLPMMASGYGFSQVRAKTDDSFLGFPSYWNVVVLYLYVMDWPLLVDVLLLGSLSALVFVPVHYVYPTRTPLLRRSTLGLGALWTAFVLAMALWPAAPWARNVGWASLFYPLWYLGVSAVHHRRVKPRRAT